MRAAAGVIFFCLVACVCAAQDGPSVGDIWTEPLTGMEFVWVDGGTFVMGCGSWAGPCGEDAHPREVAVSGFWMGKYEVTRAQWQALWGIIPKLSDEAGVVPVTEVSWRDAWRFAGELSARSGLAFELPTEAQWEYAARSGGQEDVFAGGAWHAGNNEGRVHGVGGLAPNALGLYDMSGNVWEWCRDRYGSGDDRVRRGGGWMSSQKRVRTVHRSRAGEKYDDIDLGFRLIRTP